jgi:atlastin
LSAVAGAKEVYSSQMEFVCGGDKPFMNTAALETEHARIKDKSIEYFDGRRKMGGADFSARYKEQLEKVCVDSVLSLCFRINFIEILNL